MWIENEMVLKNEHKERGPEDAEQIELKMRMMTKDDNKRAHSTHEKEFWRHLLRSTEWRRRKVVI